jgi:hypothetical protein
MEQTHDRRWTVKRIVAALVVALLAGYVGAYFATVTPHRVPLIATLMKGARYPKWPHYPQKWMYAFFSPIHQIDRALLRRHVWNR